MGEGRQGTRYGWQRNVSPTPLCLFIIPARAFLNVRVTWQGLAEGEANVKALQQRAHTH